MLEYSAQSYLARLAATMRKGLTGMSSKQRDTHASALLDFLRSDGGFAGRRGGSDLYYTGFALRALHALGRVSDDLANEVAEFMASREPEDVVDYLSVANTFFLLDRPVPDVENILGGLESLRAADGGYAKRAECPAGDLYLTFLAALCYDLFGLEMPRAQDFPAFLTERSAPDGGFARVKAVRHSGTNPTAAGIALLLLKRSANVERLKSAAQFLLGSRDVSGGWTAGARAPLPDLLSTYTALVSLESLKALDADSRSAARAFAESCECVSGGFSAGPWDPDIDVEYTYYGLGIIALTPTPAPSPA